jgi:hypothetical protein
VTRSADILPTLAGLVGFALPDLPTLSGVDLTPAISGGRRAPTLAARSHTADAAPAARLAVALSTRESLFRLDGAGGAFPLEVATRRAAGAQVVSAGDPQNPLHRRMLIELEAYREMLESDRRVRGGGSRQRGADGSSGAREIGQT